jgi:hypothetical protein
VQFSVEIITVSAAIFLVPHVLEPEAYFIVTFNAVVKPVFTVALVLMLANPGAATMTV